MTDRANYTSGGYRGGGPASQMRPPQKIPSASRRRNPVTDPKPTRTVKDPATRAKEAVDVLERRLAKLRDKAEALDGEAHLARLEIGQVEKRLEYAKANPDLARTTVAEPTTASLP